MSCIYRISTVLAVSASFSPSIRWWHKLFCTSRLRCVKRLFHRFFSYIPSVSCLEHCEYCVTKCRFSHCTMMIKKGDFIKMKNAAFGSWTQTVSSYLSGQLLMKLLISYTISPFSFLPKSWFLVSLSDTEPFNGCWLDDNVQTGLWFFLPLIYLSPTNSYTRSAVLTSTNRCVYFR